MQKQLASERSEPSGGVGNGKGRHLFPFQVACLLADFFFVLSILCFDFYLTKDPGPRLGEELNRKEIEATYAAAKKNPEKKFRLILDSNILPMQLECCTSISQ